MTAHSVSLSWKYGMLLAVSKCAREWLVSSDGLGLARESVEGRKARVMRELKSLLVYSREGGVDTDEDEDLRPFWAEEGAAKKDRVRAAREAEIVEKCEAGWAWVELARHRALALLGGGGEEEAEEEEKEEVEEEEEEEEEEEGNVAKGNGGVLKKRLGRYLEAPQITKQRNWVRDLPVSKIRAITWACQPSRRKFLRSQSPLLLLLMVDDVFRASKKPSRDRERLKQCSRNDLDSDLKTTDPNTEEEDTEEDGDAKLEGDTGAEDSDAKTEVEDEENEEEEVIAVRGKAQKKVFEAGLGKRGMGCSTSNGKSGNGCSTQSPMPSHGFPLLPRLLVTCDEYLRVDPTLAEQLGIDPSVAANMNSSHKASTLDTSAGAVLCQSSATSARALAPSFKSLHPLFSSSLWRELIQEEFSRFNSILSFNNSSFASAASREERRGEAKNGVSDPGMLRLRLGGRGGEQVDYLDLGGLNGMMLAWGDGGKAKNVGGDGSVDEGEEEEEEEKEEEDEEEVEEEEGGMEDEEEEEEEEEEEDEEKDSDIPIRSLIKKLRR